jgi:biotin carboxyl carrier protein
MAVGRARSELEMKYETFIAGRAGTIQIDGAHFRYQREDGRSVEGEFSIEKLEPGCHSVLIGGRSYRVTSGMAGVEVFDPRGWRARKAGTATQGRHDVIAPMPGKVVRLLVAVGDAVEPGQGLVVVEAMKMQNEIKSRKAGRVAEVRTKPGAAVTAGEILLVVE